MKESSIEESLIQYAFYFCDENELDAGKLLLQGIKESYPETFILSLIKFGADLYAHEMDDPKGYTIHAALYFKYEQAAKLLVQNGVSIYQKSNGDSGETALECAFRYSSRNFINFILAKYEANSRCFGAETVSFDFLNNPLEWLLQAKRNSSPALYEMKFNMLSDCFHHLEDIWRYQRNVQEMKLESNSELKNVVALFQNYIVEAAPHREWDRELSLLYQGKEVIKWLKDLGNLKFRTLHDAFEHLAKQIGYSLKTNDFIAPELVKKTITPENSVQIVEIIRRGKYPDFRLKWRLSYAYLFIAKNVDQPLKEIAKEEKFEKKSNCIIC